MQKMLTIDETTALIQSGAHLCIAADEVLLERLPKGSWIGGTIPYFMGDDGGLCTQDLLYVDVLSASVEEVCIKTYDVDSLSQIPCDAFDSGFSVIILPASSAAHLRFAQDSMDYEGIFLHPLIGWIAGVKLDDLGTTSAKTINGETGDLNDVHAIVLHARIPTDKTAVIGIVNVFAQGNGDTLVFDATGFSQESVRVNGGEPRSFAAFVRDQDIDTRLPLVADYRSAMINVSIQAVPDDESEVVLYAPVFAGVEYRFARPVGDYVEEFTRSVPALENVEFSCNCILNYLYSELEGRRTGELTGPMTFGEVAYQLLNQTLVHLTVQ